MKTKKVILKPYQEWKIQKELDKAMAKRLNISVAEVKKRKEAETRTINEIRQEIARYKKAKGK